MLETYIKNRGMTKTLIHSNNRNEINEIKWDADYDGNTANLDLDIESKGHHNKFHFSLDNNDLANLLNVDSINVPLDQRLKKDFKKSIKQKPLIYQIEVAEDNNPLISPFLFPKKERYVELLQPESLSFLEQPMPILEEQIPMPEKPKSLEEIIIPPRPYLSSPRSNEEFIIPVTIGNRTSKNYTLTPSRKHRKLKTNKSYRVYKKLKTISHSKKNKKSPSNFKSRKNYITI
jgi:hypothetical protein